MQSNVCLKELYIDSNYGIPHQNIKPIFNAPCLEVLVQKLILLDKIDT